MNRPCLAVLALFATLAPAAALAQADPHAGMAMQDHATMQAAPTPQGVVTSPADNFMGAAPTAFSVTFPHPMTLTSVKLTSAAGQAVDVLRQCVGGYPYYFRVLGIHVNSRANALVHHRKNGRSVGCRQGYGRSTLLRSSWLARTTGPY